MNLKFFIQNLIENKERLLKGLAIGLIAFLILRNYYSVSKNSLPIEVHEAINTSYSSCAEVPMTGDVPALPGPTPCTDLTINVLGPGTLTDQDWAEGITEAICFRVLIEKPFMKLNEVYPVSIRISSKVAVLQEGEWIVLPDLYVRDSELWSAYACPGDFDIALEEWREEYN
ncbi:MAG TPA: hypothetical protein VLA72_22760 [Anaerolineales bacterium]|nr:hypothetical protein [Anaerolineales bacterium]